MRARRSFHSSQANPTAASPFPPGAASAGLRRQQAPERLAALLRAHQQLLAKIALKKKELLRFEKRVDDVMQEAARRMQPVVAEVEQLDEECHRLFAELLSRKRQPRRATGVVKDLYRMLQSAGVLSPRRTAPSPSPGDAGAGARTTAAEEEEATDFAEDRGAWSPPRGGGFSARQPSEGEAGQSLRSLFRRLANALHPDKVQVEEEKARRTEVMKELTQAYKSGDLARLIELERTWAAGAELTPQSDELEQRCAALQQTNEALRAQLDQLMRELRELRRSPHAELLRDVERSARQSGKEPIAAMVDEASEHRATLQELLSFITAYRDGRIGLDELMEGPPSVRRSMAPDELEDMLDVLLELDELAPSRRRSRGKRGRGPSHPAYWEDIPY